MAEKSKEDQLPVEGKFDNVIWEFEATEDAKHRLNLIFKLLLYNELQ